MQEILEQLEKKRAAARLGEEELGGGSAQRLVATNGLLGTGVLERRGHHMLAKQPADVRGVALRHERGRHEHGKRELHLAAEEDLRDYAAD